MGSRFLAKENICLKIYCPVLFSTLLFISCLLPCRFIFVYGQEQNPAKENKQDEWNPYSAGPVTTWTAPLCGKGKFVIQPFYFYNHTRGVFDDNGKYVSLGGTKKHEYQQQLFMQYGITDRFEIDAQTLYQEHYIKTQEGKASSQGLGDSFLFLRYCALEEKDFLPDINFLFQAKFPTGKYQHLDPSKLGADLMGAITGPGSYDFGYGVVLTKKIKPFIAHADLTYTFPTDVKVDGVKTRYNRYLNFDAAVEYFFTDNFNFIFEANSLFQGDTRASGAYISNSDIKQVILSPGFGWSCESVQTLLAYQRVVYGANVDANDSVVFTLVYKF